MTWAWDASVGRYRDLKTGRFLSFAFVREWAQQSLDATADKVYFLAQNVVNLTLSPDDFNTFFREEIKKEYIRQFLIGIGGLDRMTPEYWGSIGGMLIEQYKWLDAFVAEIAGGTLSVEQIYQRMTMYILSAREAYERAVSFVNGLLGATQELWVLGQAEHCQDCVDFSDEGWQPYGHFPFPGQGKTECLTKCKCHKEYR
jgi:hypothetical protein